MKILNIKLIGDVFNHHVTATAFDLHFEKMVRLYGDLENPAECFASEFNLGVQLNRRVCENTVKTYIATIPQMDYVAVYVTQLTVGVMHLINTLRERYGNCLRIYGITNKYEILPCTVATETKTINLDDVQKGLPFYKFLDAIPELFKFKVTPLGELDLVYYEELELRHTKDLTEYADLYTMLDHNYIVRTEFAEDSLKPEARQNKLRLV